MTFSIPRNISITRNLTEIDNFACDWYGFRENNKFFKIVVRKKESLISKHRFGVL